MFLFPLCWFSLNYIGWYHFSFKLMADEFNHEIGYFIAYFLLGRTLKGLFSSLLLSQQVSGYPFTFGQPLGSVLAHKVSLFGQIFGVQKTIFFTYLRAALSLLYTRFITLKINFLHTLKRTYIKLERKNEELNIQ